MANIKWRGGAATRAESRVWTIGGTWANGETISATVGSRTITVTLSAGAASSTTTVAAALAAAFNGSAATASETRDFLGTDFPEMDEITAGPSGANITFTHDTAGIPFSVTLGEGSTSGTVSAGTVVAATGPNHWDNAANWSGGAVPVNSDNVYIEDTDVDILYGLDQSSVTLAALHISSTFTGHIGLDSIRNRDEDTEYAEYRQLPLALGATTLMTIGAGDGEGSPRLRIRRAGNGNLIVYSTGESAVDGHPAVFFSDGDGGDVTIHGGTVWLGGDLSDQAISIDSLVIAGTEDDTPDVKLGHDGVGGASSVVASRCTLTLDCEANVDVDAHQGAEVLLLAAGGTAAMTISSGAVVRPRGVDKSYTTIDIFDGGHLDATGFAGALATGTSLICYGGSTITIPDGCTLDEIQIPKGVCIAGTKPDATAIANLNLPANHSIAITYL